MLEKGKISPRQAGELLFITIMATVILFVPAITAESAGQDAWMATIAGSSFGFVTLILIVILGRLHPGRNIFQYCEDILGRFAGKLAALLYVWFFTHIASVIVREFGDFLTTAFLPETPLSVFNFSMIFLAALAVLSGLEILARSNEFIILLVVGFLLAVIALTVPNWDLGNLMPLLENGLKPVLGGALVPAAWHGEIIVLAVILPYLTRPRQGLLSGAAAVAASGFVLTASVVGTLAIFGPTFTASMRFPIHLFVRTINIGQVLTRFEVAVMITWVAGVFVKTAVFYYCAALGLAQVFGLSEYRPVVFPLGIIMSAFSITLFEDVTELSFFLSKIWPLYGISIFFLGMPLILVGASLVKRLAARRKPERGRQDG